jgi:hypothetical protein
MRGKALKTAGIALFLSITATAVHSQDSKEISGIDSGLASTALQCAAIFDIVEPQFPDRAAEIRGYRAKAKAQFLRASQTKETDFQAYLDNMRQQVDDALKSGKLQIMPEVNDCAQIYGTDYSTVMNK